MSNLEWHKNYREKNKDKINAQHKKWYKKSGAEHSKLYMQGKRKKAIELLGSCCALCGNSNKALVIHEKAGNGHKGREACFLVLKCPEEFTLLCRGLHHFSVHAMMRYLGMPWSEIEGFIQRSRNGKEEGR